MKNEKRLIDANRLVEDTYILNSWDAPIVRAWLDDQPTVDAVEVVRCKDCKHRGNDDICPMIKIRMCNDGDGYFDEVSEDKTFDDGFCSYGKRKDNVI